MKKVIAIFICIICLSCTTTNDAEMIQQKIDALYAEFIINPEEQPRLAIVPFSSTNLSKSDTKGIQLHFEASIHDTQYFNLIEQSEAETILEAQAYSLNGCTDDACAIEVGKLLSAEQIIIGNVGTVGEIYYLNIKLINVETGAILVAKNLHANSLEELLFMIYPDFSYSGFKGFDEKEDKKEDTVNLIDFDDSEFSIEVAERSIEVDGKKDDWIDLKPIELSKYDNNLYYYRYYASQDEKYVYFRIDLKDESLFIDELNNIFFSISPSMFEYIGEINLGLTLDGGIWRKSLHQNLGDPTKNESNWKFGKLPQEFAAVDEVIEIKILKDWLPNKDNLYITLGLHNDKTGGDLYFSDRLKLTL